MQRWCACSITSWMSDFWSWKSGWHSKIQRQQDAIASRSHFVLHLPRILWVDMPCSAGMWRRPFGWSGNIRWSAGNIMDWLIIWPLCRYQLLHGWACAPPGFTFIQLTSKASLAYAECPCELSTMIIAWYPGPCASLNAGIIFSVNFCFVRFTPIVLNNLGSTCLTKISPVQYSSYFYHILISGLCSSTIQLWSKWHHSGKDHDWHPSFGEHVHHPKPRISIQYCVSEHSSHPVQQEPGAVPQNLPAKPSHQLLLVDSKPDEWSAVPLQEERYPGDMPWHLGDCGHQNTALSWIQYTKSLHLGATDVLCSAKCPSSLSAGCKKTAAAWDNSSILLASHHLQPLEDISLLPQRPTSPLKTLSTLLNSLPICLTGHMHRAQHGLPGHRVWSKFFHDALSLTVGGDTPWSMPSLMSANTSHVRATT